MQDAFDSLYRTITHRVENPIDGSYTCYLFVKGLDKILKKVGEEAAETIIAAKNADHKQLIDEIGDLIYHVEILMAFKGVTPEEIRTELLHRAHKSGNLKPEHQTDKDT